MANLLSYLKKAVEDQASDIFIIAGGSISEKIDGHIRPMEADKLMPPETEEFIKELYTLILILL